MLQAAHYAACLITTQSGEHQCARRYAVVGGERTLAGAVECRGADLIERSGGGVERDKAHRGNRAALKKEVWLQPAGK